MEIGGALETILEIISRMLRRVEGRTQLGWLLQLLWGGDESYNVKTSVSVLVTARRQLSWLY
jgi:hypothetical protein